MEDGGDLEELLLQKVEGEVVGGSLLRRIWEEEKKLWVVAGPAMITRFSNYAISVISQAFMGNINSIELAAYAIVFTVLTRFAIGVMLGMASALETLCGQSYGAGRYHMLGVYLQRSWLVVLPFTTLLLPFFIFATPLLILLGQDETVAAAAGNISLWFIPIVFAYAMSFTLQMYLQNQSRNSIVTYWSFGALLIHVLLSYLLCNLLHLGVAGVMGSTIISLWIPVFGQLLFVLCGGCRETWRGFTVAAFKDLWPVLKLSMSSGVMICLEFWYKAILPLLVGHMANAEVAIDALSICLNVSGSQIMIAFGFMAGVGARVANELGGGSAKRAKLAIYVAVCTSSVIGAVFFIACLIIRGNIAYVFTKDLKVIEAVDDLSFLMALSILLNSFQPVLSGVAIGAGQQKIVAYVNLGCYYLLGLPVGVIFGYVVGLGVKGVWIGMIGGVAVQTMVLIIITWRTDWNAQVALAKTRVKRWQLPVSEEFDNGGRNGHPI